MPTKLNLVGTYTKEAMSAARAKVVGIDSINILATDISIYQITIVSNWS